MKKYYINLLGMRCEKEKQCKKKYIHKKLLIYKDGFKAEIDMESEKIQKEIIDFEKKQNEIEELQLFTFKRINKKYVLIKKKNIKF